MILVTGATGHIGNTLIRLLLQNNPQAKVRALVLPSADLTPLEGLAVEIVYGNVLDSQSLDDAMQGIDVVFHLAGLITIRAEQLALVEQVNIQGTENVARAALKAGVRRMLHVASIHIFERIPTGVIDETIPLVTKENSAGVYDYTKAEAVRRLRPLINEGLDVVIACPTGVLGPNDYLGSEIGTLIREYLASSNHVILDGGYDWVDVRDVAHGLIRLAEAGATGELYLLGGRYMTMDAFIRQIGSSVPKTFRIMNMPYPVVFLAAHVSQALAGIFKITPKLTPYSLRTLRDNANISHQKAVDAVGFSTRPIEETFKDLIAWYQAHPPK